MLNARPVRRLPGPPKSFRPVRVALRPREDGRTAPPAAPRRAFAHRLAWLRPLVVVAALGALGASLLVGGPGGDRITGWLADTQGIVAHGAVRAERVARGQLALLTSIADLEAQNARLRWEVRDLRERDRERMSLGRMLDLSERADLVGVGARVVARGVGGRQTVRIDTGTERGVAAGLAVIGPNGIVGQVLDAGPGWADVLCVTDPMAGLAGRIDGGPHGILRGTRTGLAMDHVLARHTVAPGALVLATGEGGVFPAGQVVGVVRAVEPQPGTPFLAIAIDAVSPPDLLDEVLVVTGARPPGPEVANR